MMTQSVDAFKAHPGALDAQAQRTWVLAAAISGNALEFYDFIVYAFFATYIGAAFFPPGAALPPILAALAVFGVGFIARPLGAIALGAYADRHGRRPALLLAMLLTTAATLSMAVLPTYGSIGAAAPLLLVACRLLQGFALGGEVGPATAYLLEASPSRRSGFVCSWFFAGQGAAVLMAGVIGTGLTWTLPNTVIAEWGWRASLLASVLLAPIGLYLRAQLQETAQPRRQRDARIAAPSSKLPARQIALLTLAILGGTVANYVFTYMTTYAITTLKLSPAVSLSTPIAIGVATIAGALLGGWLSDHAGRKPILVGSRLLCSALAVPLFALLIKHPTMTVLWISAGTLALLNALNGGVLFAAMPESFESRNRAMGSALVYAVGVALFGGSTQFAVAWLTARWHDPLVPAWYIAGSGVVALVALAAMPESRRSGP